MKNMTKEWVKDLEFLDLIVTLEPRSNKKTPFVFTNGGTDGIAKEDLYTVKTNFNLSEKENEISFVMIPETYCSELDLLGDGEEITDETRKNDFLYQYVNNLRVISYLPEDMLKLVKNKRLLALGYAEEEVKKVLLQYMKSKYGKAIDLFERCSEACVEAEDGLTIHEQFKNCIFSHSVPHLFDGVKITKADKIKDEIHLTLDDNESVVFSGADIIEEEIEIVNSYVKEIELYKKSSYYELHFLIEKADKNLIKHYYYVTYSFKDLKFND